MKELKELEKSDNTEARQGRFNIQIIEIPEENQIKGKEKNTKIYNSKICLPIKTDTKTYSRVKFLGLKEKEKNPLGFQAKTAHVKRERKTLGISIIIRKWSNIFKGRKCEPGIFYTVKVTFKYKGHRQTVISM